MTLSPPIILTTLYSIFTDALATQEPDLKVSLGPLVTGQFLPEKYLTVGHFEIGRGMTRPVVDMTQGLSDMGNNMMDQYYDVHSQLSVAQGDETDEQALVVITNASAIFDTVVASIQSERTLRGAVDPPGYADVRKAQWYVEKSDTGTVVTVNFTVHVEVVSRGW